VLKGGRIGIVVGDCVGHGLRAATVMGQLRSACRALLLQDPRPERVLTALDRFAEEIPDALCTTVFCGTLDPRTGTLVYSSAGHPPGIIALPDGGTRLLEEGRAMPLAVLPGSPRPRAEIVIPPHGTLLLYTDGLVERRRGILTDGIDLAAKCLDQESEAPVGELPSRIMARMAPATGYEDDVALLLYRRPGA
jgi:serine phosphatase RsbU (regulator of sigma subunit)